MFSKNSFHILRFLLVFFLLKIGFNLYIGILSPGGKAYSPFLQHYLNFPAWLTYFICKCAKGLLQLMGYSVYQKALNNVTIMGSRGINIIWACLGLGVMSFWTAFVTAHTASFQYKLKWITFGILLITGINILRIASIALGFYYNWKAFNAIEPHFAFNVVSYIAISVLTIWFVVKYKKTSNNHPHPTSKKSTVLYPTSS